jgi:two-component system chemotaxis response regulator CheB
VLVVDDSAMVRKLVVEALKNDPEIEVVGTAMDPFIARDKIKQLNPDVLTLDLEMPRMDGLTFLKILMEQHPLPVIIMSSLTQSGSDHAIEALRLGAFDVLAKPGGPYSFGDLGPQLISRIKASSGARIRGRRAENRGQRPETAEPRSIAASRAPFPARPPFSGSRPPSSVLRSSNPPLRHPRDLILLGASTGGTEALREILTRLPAALPPIAIVQHIPAMFSKTFADRLDQICSLEVREAVDGDRLEPGLALVAPGNFHLVLQWRADHYCARVISGPAVWHQRPAVDLLFKSVVDCGGAPHTVAGVLTGMGRDGADGLLRLRERGAITFAQDEPTSVVYGMPRVAWETGAAQRQLPLEHVAEFLLHPSDSTSSLPPLAAAPA